MQSWNCYFPHFNSRKTSAQYMALARQDAELCRLLAERVCNLNSSSFKEIVDKFAFVDKTLFIKKFLTAKNAIWLTAPPRFGKSTMIDMVRSFLSVQVDENAQPVARENNESFKLFQKYSLKICTVEGDYLTRHCGKYPVIHVDLGKVEGKAKSEVLHALRGVVQDVYQQFSYLVKRVDDEWVWNSRCLQESTLGVEYFVENLDCSRMGPLSKEHYGMEPWKFLFEVLEKHFQARIYVLIDNCDAPITNAIKHEDLRTKEYVSWVDEIITELIDFLMVRVSGRQALLARNVGMYTPDRFYLSQVHQCYHPVEYSRWVGFTKEEVYRLLKKPVFSMLKLEDIERWYGRYEAYEERWNKTVHIYNTWSVLNFMQKSVIKGHPDFQLYWPDTSCIFNLENLFRVPKIRDDFRNILFNGNTSNTFVVDTSNVDLYQFVKLMSISCDDDEDVSAVPYVDFDEKYGGKTVDSKICYLYLNLLLALHYSGYLNKSVIEFKEKLCMYFYVPNIEILKSLLMKFMPQVFPKNNSNVYVTLHHFWEY